MTATAPVDRHVWPGLSDRELQVLRHAANGNTASETAGQIYLSATGVRAAISRAMVKLGARNITHAVSICWRLGLMGETP